MEQSIQQFVMCRISIYQACCGFGQQLRMSTMAVFVWQAWNESYWTVLLGYPTISKMLAAIKHIAAEITLFFRKQHIIALCMQHSPTAAAKELNFIGPELQSPTIQCWTPLITKFLHCSFHLIIREPRIQDTKNMERRLGIGIVHFPVNQGILQSIVRSCSGVLGSPGCK